MIQKSKVFTVRFTEEQFEWLKNQAKERNVNISDILNMLVDKERLGFIGYLKHKFKRIKQIS
jgi:hypothetical protein